MFKRMTWFISPLLSCFFWFEPLPPLHIDWLHEKLHEQLLPPDGENSAQQPLETHIKFSGSKNSSKVSSDSRPFSRKTEFSSEQLLIVAQASLITLRLQNTFNITFRHCFTFGNWTEWKREQLCAYNLWKFSPIPDQLTFLCSSSLPGDLNAVPRVGNPSPPQTFEMQERAIGW